MKDNKRKPIVSGLDYIRSRQWKPIVTTREGAVKEGNKRMPGDLKKLGFKTSVFDGGNYYRISYGRK